MILETTPMMTKGMQQGIEQGIEQGKKDEKLEIARNMKSEGLDSELIKKITGLEEGDY